RLIDPRRAAAGPAAVIGQWLDDFVGEVLEQPWVAMLRQTSEVVEPHIPSTPVVGIVACQGVEQWTDRDFDDVTRAVGEEFEAAAIGPNAHHSAAALAEPPSIGTRGYHESEIANRRVQPAIRAQFKAVR